MSCWINWSTAHPLNPQAMMMWGVPSTHIHPLRCYKGVGTITAMLNGSGIQRVAIRGSYHCATIT